MKKFKKIFVLLLAVLFLGACADSKRLPTADGQDTKRYGSVGLFNKHSKAPHVCYEIVVGNVIWSIFLIETVVFPAYFIGWSIMEPHDLKENVEDPNGCW